MTWINPLDRLPQIPQDWANHIAYGGISGVALIILGLSSLQALLIMLIVSATKKIVDYFKEFESWKVCLGKTFITVIWPFSIWALHLYGKM